MKCLKFVISPVYILKMEDEGGVYDERDGNKIRPLKLKLNVIKNLA